MNIHAILQPSIPNCRLSPKFKQHHGTHWEYLSHKLRKLVTDKILIWTRLTLDWIKTPLHQEEMHFLTTQKYNVSPLQKNKPASSIDTDFLIEHPTCCAPNLSCL